MEKLRGRHADFNIMCYTAVRTMVAVRAGMKVAGGCTEGEAEGRGACCCCGRAQGFTKNVMGPVKWEAPESLQRKEYSEKTDAFSFGVCLYEMVAAKEPWEGETHGQVAYQVSHPPL